MKKMISRRDFLKVAGISAAALGLAACGGSGTSTAASTASTAASTGSSAAASGSAVTLKLGFSTNEEDPRAKGAKQFAEEVAEKTGGAVEVQLYPSGQLGGDADLINSIALDSGTISSSPTLPTFPPTMQRWAFPHCRSSSRPSTMHGHSWTATSRLPLRKAC